MSVIVTETAAREIDSIIRQQGLDPAKIHLRVGVKGGGCSGFSYLLDLTEIRKDNDELWEVSYTRRPDVAVKAQGHSNAESQVGTGGGSVATANATASAPETFAVKVICDPKSYLYVNGTTIDFKDEVMGRGFVFNNPNATTTCGCGSSFSA